MRKLLCIGACLFFCSTSCFASPTAPGQVEVRQPDGSSLQDHVRGGGLDERYPQQIQMATSNSPAVLIGIDGRTVASAASFSGWTAPPLSESRETAAGPGQKE
jgi:hypothetical protein